MTHDSEEREFYDLFQKQLPPVQMPPELAAKLRRSVMSDVAEVLNTADADAYYSQTLTSGQLRSDPVKSASEGNGMWSALSRMAHNLRWAPSLGLAGATVAVAIFFYYLVPQLYPPEGVPASPQTGSGVSAPLVLPSVSPEQQMAATVTIGDGNATVIGANGTRQDLGSGESTEMRPGDELITLTGSALIDYFPNQMSHVEPGVRLELLEVGEQNNGTQVTIFVHVGATRHELNVALGTNDRFEVRTPSSTASAVGTDFIVDARTKTETYYTVYAGVILVEMDERRSAVVAGEQLLAVQGQPMLAELREPAEAPAASEEAVAASIPVDEAAADDSQEVEPSPTEEPTSTDVPPTMTPAPTSTELPTATATTLPTNTPTTVPTSTPTVTETATSSPTPTPTSTSTRRPLPTSTPTVTAVPISLQLSVPNDRVGGSGDTTFAWRTSGVPTEGQAYEVIFWKDGQNPLINGFGISQPTRSNAVSVDLDALDDRLDGLLDPGEYRWGVLLVNREPYERLRLFEDSRLFRYNGRESSVPAPSAGE